MKRLALTFVAVLALFSTVQTARADWVVEVNSNGWVVARWDSGFDDGTFNPPPPAPKPPVLVNGIWYLIFFSPFM